MWLISSIIIKSSNWKPPKFDKYGEDSLKRSLNNQLISQVGYPVMLHNVIVVPAWSWRVFIGPLNVALADLVLLTGNTIVIWISLCFLENMIVKAAMATKYVLKLKELFVLLKIKHWIQGPFKYYVSMFLMFLDPPNHCHMISLCFLENMIVKAAMATK